MSENTLAVLDGGQIRERNSAANQSNQPARVTSFQPTSAQELMQFAAMIADSDLVPKDMRGKPANIILAIQQGAELGMKPMQALQSIAVINGRPTLWGDGLLGLVQASGLLEDFEEQIDCDDKGAPIAAACMVKRAGRNREKIVVFSVEDAKKAGLWGKPGPWQQYPKRMLQLRARSFALRDEFADVLKGMQTAEEAIDMVMELDAPAAAHQASADKATAVRERMRQQMARQGGGGPVGRAPVPQPGTQATVPPASASPAGGPTAAGATLAGTPNRSGAQCPSCHAPDGKPHGAKCKAPAAEAPAAPQVPAPMAKGLAACPACGEYGDCTCTIEERDAALQAHADAQGEALTGTLVDVEPAAEVPAAFR